MLKQRNEQIQLAVKVTDLLISVFAFFAAFWLRKQAPEWLPFRPEQIAEVISLESQLWMLGASVVLHFVSYSYLDFYASLRLKSYAEIIQQILKAFLIEFFVLGTLVFLLQAKDTSRYFFVLFLVLNYASLLTAKLSIRVLQTSIRRRGYNYRQVLVVGTGPNAIGLIRKVQDHRHWGYVVTGVLQDQGTAADSPLEVGGIPVLGHYSSLPQIVLDRAVDEVIFAVEKLDSSRITEEVALCEKLGIPARFSLSFLEVPLSKIAFGQLDNIPLLTFYRHLHTPLDAILKRSMDVVISLIGLLLTAALYPWIAARIRKESPGPVIFKQHRVGENGRIFKCYKFRTMVLDADAKKAELAAKNLMQGPMFKVENDPRIFPFGAFLRKTSLDELPQFFNILRGDMSVVGTRPPTPDEVKQYETHYRRRLSIRPGLTGLWQVRGRNHIHRFEEVLALDLEYIDRWSIWLDLRIIFETVWVVLARKGAQ